MRARLKGVYKSRKTLADGSTKTYYCLREYGALKPLDGDEDAPFAPGSPAFMRSYYAAIEAPRVARTAGKRFIDMPVTRSLKALLDAQPRTAATILTRNGKPWGSVNFDHRWRETVLKADRNGLHFHDLRGTACTVLAQAGATPSEIAAMLGWTVSTVARMLDLYQAMTASLSDSAVAKLEARETKLRKKVRNAAPRKPKSGANQ